MVQHSISKLNKSFIVSNSMLDIKHRIASIPDIDNNYKAAPGRATLNAVTLETKEFLNSAVFVVFNLVYIDEHKTELILEIKREKHSVNQNFKPATDFVSIESLIKLLSEAVCLNS